MKSPRLMADADAPRLLDKEFVSSDGRKFMKSSAYLDK
jgi:hypothetical protein